MVWVLFKDHTQLFWHSVSGFSSLSVAFMPALRNADFSDDEQNPWEREEQFDETSMQDEPPEVFMGPPSEEEHEGQPDEEDEEEPEAELTACHADSVKSASASNGTAAVPCAILPVVESPQETPKRKGVWSLPPTHLFRWWRLS